jgi:hypothetical protein
MARPWRVSLIAVIAFGAAIMVSNFRERALNTSGRELESTARPQNRAIVPISRIFGFLPALIQSRISSAADITAPASSPSVEPRRRSTTANAMNGANASRIPISPRLSLFGRENRPATALSGQPSSSRSYFRWRSICVTATATVASAARAVPHSHARTIHPRYSLGETVTDAMPAQPCILRAISRARSSSSFAVFRSFCVIRHYYYLSSFG